MVIPLCEKTKDVIEPYMTPQWWVRMREMADAGLKVVEDGTIKITPDSARKMYDRWLTNLNDWCISRQLWYVSLPCTTILSAYSFLGGVTGFQPTASSLRVRMTAKPIIPCGLLEGLLRKPRPRLRRSSHRRSSVWSRILTASILGSAPGCGLCPLSAGPIPKIRTTRTSSPPARWKRVGIS